MRKKRKSVSDKAGPRKKLMISGNNIFGVTPDEKGKGNLL